MQIKPLKLILISLLLLANQSNAVEADSNDRNKFLDFPFWKKMVGVWESDNTYFDSKMNYTIRSYSSLIHIQINGVEYLETEHRFYPDGIASIRYGKGLMQAGEGIELITNYSGALINRSGSMGNTQVDHAGASGGSSVEYKILSDDEAVRTTKDPKSSIDSYRRYTSFITDSQRLRSTIGFYTSDKDHSPGSVRAYILHKDHKIKQNDFEQRRKELRQKYNVRVISKAHPDIPGASLVKRLD